MLDPQRPQPRPRTTGGLVDPGKLESGCVMPYPSRRELAEARTEILGRRSLLPLPDLATQCGQQGCDLAYLGIQHSHIVQRGRTYRHNPARAWWHTRTSHTQKFLISCAGISLGTAAIAIIAALALAAAIGEFK